MENHLKNNKTPPSFMGSTLMSFLYDAYPELSSQEELVSIMWDDLERLGLHRTKNLRVMMSGDFLVTRTTTLGKEFLRFISSHE